MAKRPKDLTPTSYALLGMLARQPLSAYELTRRMKRSNLRLIWPRAESKLYEEPKSLVVHGLAEAKRETDGGRRRTVYKITADGRRALRAWLDAPGAGLQLEVEAMIKVVYGDHGTKEQLLANVGRVRHDVAERSREAKALTNEAPGHGPHVPERAHLDALANRFVIEVLQATLRWAEWAEATVEAWASTALDEAVAAQARRLHRQNADALEAMATAARETVDDD